MSEHTTAPPTGDDATVDLDSAHRAQPRRASSGRMRCFGDYEILEEIARGGMGVVFEARQLSLNRTVALKMILAGQLADETDVKRFRTEAEAAASLDHPGIVPIYEVGEHEGQHFFSMGFVEGQSLAQRLLDGPMPVRTAADLIRRVSHAIEFAHQRGVIHRDLKPANILLEEDGSPRVTDFGLAKNVEGDSALTGSGQILGTPSYMPPEQARGKRDEVGPAADIYALGATLYALATGRPPFQAATPVDTVIQVLSDEPVPPRRLNASIPPDFETICLKCLEKTPAKRYPTALALGDDLARFLAGEPIMARPGTSLERTIKWARRRPAIASLLGLVVLVTALGLGGVLWQWRAAVLARDKARARELEARIAEAKERKQTELAQQRLYDVRMNFVQRDWEEYHGDLMRQGLEEQRPANQSGVDRRGFEWFYWQRKLASGHITLKGHAGFVLSVAFSPDGKRIASAGGDGMVKVWDSTTGEERLTLKGHTSFPTSVAFSPDGKRLASGGNDRVVRVWDAMTGEEALTLKGHAALVNGVCFSPDGRILASASFDGTVKLWDGATGAVARTLKGHKSAISSVAFSPDGKLLASAGGLQLNKPGELKVWNVATGQETLTIKGCASGVVSVAYSPDGKRLAAASADRTVKVWDAVTAVETLTIKGHAGSVVSVAFSPDGKTLGTASNDQTVRVWDAATGLENLILKGHTKSVASVAFDPGGRRLASASTDGTVKVWDLATGQEPLTLKRHAGDVLSVAFSPDSKRLASASLDQTVKLWDTATWHEVLTFDGHKGGVVSVAFSPDGERLASSAGFNGTVKIWDGRTGQQFMTLTGQESDGSDGILSVAFSPDGMRLALASSDQSVKVWDVATGQEVLILKGHTSSVAGAAFSPDGKRLASVEAAGWGPGQNLERRDRSGNLHIQGAYQLGLERGVQSERQAGRGLWRQRPGDQSLERRDRAGNVHAQGPHRGCYQRGVQPGREAARLRRRGSDRQGLGCCDRAGDAHSPRTHRRGQKHRFQPRQQVARLCR